MVNSKETLKIYIFTHDHFGVTQGLSIHLFILSKISFQHGFTIHSSMLMHADDFNDAEKAQLFIE